MRHVQEYRARFIGKHLRYSRRSWKEKRESEEEGAVRNYEKVRRRQGGKRERGSLLLNEKLDRACRNAIFRRIHLVETFLPREKIQSNPEGER